MAEFLWDWNRSSGSYRHRRGHRHPEMETDQNACDYTIRPGGPGTPEHVVDTTHPGQTYIKLDKTREVLEILQRAADLKPEVERELEAATKETGSESQTRIQELETENRELREKNENYEMTINQYKYASNRADRSVGEIKQEKEDLQDKLKSAENLIYKLQDEVRMEQEKSERAEQKAAKSAHDCERAVSALEKERQESKEKYFQLQNKYKECVDRVASELEKERRSGKECRKQLEDQLMNAENQKQVSEQLKQLVEVKDSAFREKAIELDVIRKELNKTKSSLSTMMSHKMSKSNPNIADLSDQNRPTNLAEMFSTLYDDEYTNAFEELDLYYKVEKDRCEKLLELLLEAFKFCARKADELLRDLKKECLAGNQMSTSFESTPLVDFSLEEIKEIRKKNAKKSVVSVYKEFVVHMTNAKGSTIFKHRSVFPKTIEYLIKCVELCWLMAVQDPPLVFGPLPQKNDKFDDKLYRSYTRSGSHVDFAVWPVMYLHENGAVLSRGVVEAIDQSSSDRYHDNHDTGHTERYVTQVQSDYRGDYDSKSPRLVSASDIHSHENLAHSHDRYHDKDDRNRYVTDTLDGYHGDYETNLFRPISAPITYGHTNTTRRDVTHLFSNTTGRSSDTGDNHRRTRNYHQDIVSPSVDRHYSPRTSARSSSRSQAKAESRKFQAWR